jgi:hypothetical protein
MVGPKTQYVCRFSYRKIINIEWMNTGTTVMLGIGPDQDSASEIKYKYVKKKKSQEQ